MAFRGLTTDRTPINEFRAWVPEAHRKNKPGLDNLLPLHAFEWREGQALGLEISNIKSVKELASQCQGQVRVVFAPRDDPHPSTVEGFIELFDSYGIPSAFVDESLQGISQSFGTQLGIDGATYTWFHFLCKDIAVEGNRIVHPRSNSNSTHVGNEARIAAQQQSQANFSWLKSGFVLKTRNPGLAQPLRTTSSASDSTLAAPSTQAQVELFCFGAPRSLRDRFRRVKTMASSEELLQDPYALLEIVFEELYKVLDRTSWAVADIFGSIETKTLAMASKPGKANKELHGDHFTGLHNLAKHAIYLRENCESAMATLEDLREDHWTKTGKHLNSPQKHTQQALRYRKSLFQSTQRRLVSLDARMANIIELSFHIVTQGDSRLMQSESQSMSTIAVTTLIFLPLSTVAGIFGTQFIKLEDEKPYHVTVSSDFWLLWVIVVPVTSIVLIIWRVWYLDARGRLIDELPQGIKGEHGYLSWKSLRGRRKLSAGKAQC